VNLNSMFFLFSCCKCLCFDRTGNSISNK